MTARAGDAKVAKFLVSNRFRRAVLPADFTVLSTRSDGGVIAGRPMIKVHAERLHYWDGYDEGEIKI